MHSKILTTSILMISSIFLISSLALAGGKGKNKSKNTPPGWEQGEKTGWKGEGKPPGLSEEAAGVKEKAEKEQDKHKEKYESELETQKEKRESELETEKEKIKTRAKKKDS